MGKDKAEERNHGKRRGLNRGPAEVADWGSVDADYIRSAIATAARTGGALRFGYTSDGGAYALGIYGDGEKPYTEFIGPNDSVETVLEQVVALFDTIWADNGQNRG